MGTRNLICIFYSGRFVIAQYTERDGYPRGQGVAVLKFLSDSANIKRLIKGVQHIYMPNDEDLNTIQDVNRSVIDDIKTRLRTSLDQCKEKLDELKEFDEQVMKRLSTLQIDQTELEGLFDKLSQDRLSQMDKANELLIKHIWNDLHQVCKKVGNRISTLNNNSLITERLECVRNRLQNMSNDELCQIMEKVHKEEKYWQVYELASRLVSEDDLESLWPSLSHNTGAHILKLVAQATAEKRVPIQLNLEFANDGLYCEWAYVVDLDNDVLEVYAGAQSKENATSKRFNNVGSEDDMVPAFVKSFCFTELPTEEEFIAALSFE